MVKHFDSKWHVSQFSRSHWGMDQKIFQKDDWLAYLLLHYVNPIFSFLRTWTVPGILSPVLRAIFWGFTDFDVYDGLQHFARSQGAGKPHFPGVWNSFETGKYVIEMLCRWRQDWTSCDVRSHKSTKGLALRVGWKGLRERWESWWCHPQTS